MAQDGDARAGRGHRFLVVSFDVAPRVAALVREWTPMSFLFDVPSRADANPVPVANGSHSSAGSYSSAPGEAFNDDLIAKRSTLLGEKLKLHGRIIDEFNLTLLEKLPRAELVRQVNAYVANYVRAENISLNQRNWRLSPRKSSTR